MFKNLTQSESTIPAMTPTEAVLACDRQLAELHDIALEDASAQSLHLLGVSLRAGADPKTMLSLVDADASLSTLIGCDASVCSLEELSDKIDTAETEVKKKFWTKRKKVILASLAAAVAAIGAAAVVTRRLKSVKMAPLPMPPEHNTPTPAQPTKAPSTALVPKGPLTDRTPPPKSTIGVASTPGAAQHGAAVKQEHELSMIRKTITGHLKDIANELYEQAEKSQYAANHVKYGKEVNNHAPGSPQAKAYGTAGAYTKFPEYTKGGKKFRYKEFKASGDARDLDEMIGYINQNANYTCRNTESLMRQLEGADAAIQNKTIDPSVLSYAKELTEYGKSLGGRLDVVDKYIDEYQKVAAKIKAEGFVKSGTNPLK